MDKFTFGKYKNKDVNAICYSNPSYCLWAHNTIPFFKLTDEQLLKAKQRLDEIETAKAEWAEDTFGFGGNGLWDIGLE